MPITILNLLAHSCQDIMAAKHQTRLDFSAQNLDLGCGAYTPLLKSAVALECTKALQPAPTHRSPDILLAACQSVTVVPSSPSLLFPPLPNC